MMSGLYSGLCSMSWRVNGVKKISEHFIPINIKDGVS